MHIEQQLSLPAPASRLWDLLLDVPTVVQCIPGAESVQVLEADHYAVRIKVRVGPVSVTFDCQVAVQRLDRSSYSGAFAIIGRDTRVGAGLRATSTFSLVEEGATTRLTLSTDTDLSGKITQYGHGIIRQRAEATLQAFGECLRARLA